MALSPGGGYCSYPGIVWKKETGNLNLDEGPNLEGYAALLHSAP